MEVKPGYKQTEVGVIPEEWEVKPLGDLLANAMQNGVFNEPSRKGKGTKLINVIDLYRRFPIDPSDLLRFDASRDELIRFGVRKGDIFFTRSSITPDGIAHCNVFDGDTVEPLVFDCHIIRVQADPRKFDPLYLARYCTSRPARQFLVANAKTTTMTTVDQSVISNLPVAFPPLSEQRAIATALSDVDGLLGGLDRLIAKKRDLKQAAMQQLLTGQTRLPGFHGEWEVKRLGDIVEKIVGGGTPSRANTAFWGNEIPWVTVKDFATFNPQHSQESITRLGLRNSASHLIPAGTLITSTRMALGKAVVYAVDVSINQDLKALFLKPEVSVGYLTYWFEHFGSLIDELGSGSTVKGISLVELRRFPFQAPPLPEQTAIASVLTEMDGELAALERRREKTRALKQAMMQELLTGKTRLI